MARICSNYSTKGCSDAIYRTARHRVGSGNSVARHAHSYPRVFEDARGYFLEVYNENDMIEAGIRERFVQDNHSYSVRNVVRGLHYQVRYPQGKLVRVVEGEILDVAVDLRLSSTTFGNWHVNEQSSGMIQI